MLNPSIFIPFCCLRETRVLYSLNMKLIKLVFHVDSKME